MDPNQQQPTQPTGGTPQGTPAPNQPTPAPVQAFPAQQEVHDYTHPIVDKPKHQYHPKQFMLWLSILVAVCILAVVIMLLVALLPPSDSKAPTKTTTQTKQSQTEKPLTAATTIAHVKEYFKGTETAKSPLLLPVQAPNTSYYTVVPDIAPLVSVAGNVAPDKGTAQLNSIIHSLEGDKFSTNVISDGTKNTNYQAYFTRSDTTCEVDLVRPADTKADQWIEAKCLDTSVYSSYAKDQATLANLYVPLTATSVQYAFVGKPTLTPGSVSGYQRGQIQVSSVINNQTTTDGKYALYYQSPDGLWHYFIDQDNSVPVECQQYNTKDLQAAYAGVTCRDINKGQNNTVPTPKK